MMVIKKQVLFVLVVFLTANLSSHAQNPNIGDIAGDTPVGNLVVGDSSIKSVKQLYVKAPLIINFWASWCKPCILEMKLLADQVALNKGRLQVLCVGYESKKVVDHFLLQHPELKNSGLLISYGDTQLVKSYFHQSLPHNAWIDRNGKIKAITGGDEMTVVNLQHLIKGDEFSVRVKKEVKFNLSERFKVADSVPVMRSTFLARLPGVEMSGTSVSTGRLGYASNTEFRAFNSRILTLFWTAYQFPPVLQPKLYEVHTKDSSRYFSPDTSRAARGIWAFDHTYSYEFYSSKPLYDKQFYQRVIGDLELAFGIRSSLEPRLREVYKVGLKRRNRFSEATSETLDRKIWYEKDTLRIKDVPVDYLLSWMATNCALNQLTPRAEPYLNKTGIKGLISASVYLGKDKALYRQLFHLEKCLSDQLGLEFKKTKAMYPVLVLREE